MVGDYVWDNLSIKNNLLHRPQLKKIKVFYLNFLFFNTKKYNVFAPMGRFQLESIYLYFPPSSQLVYISILAGTTENKGKLFLFFVQDFSIFFALLGFVFIQGSNFFTFFFSFCKGIRLVEYIEHNNICNISVLWHNLYYMFTYIYSNFYVTCVIETEI